MRERETYRPRTQRVTCWPLSRHFSGLGSFFLHLRNSKFSASHLNPMCLDAAISTADVGIGSPLGSAALLGLTLAIPKSPIPIPIPISLALFQIHKKKREMNL